MIRPRTRREAVRACAASVALHLLVGAAGCASIRGRDHSDFAEDDAAPTWPARAAAGSDGRDDEAVIVVTAPRLVERR